ncbi:MAG: Gfo/Idh/MocA family oxidoreductase [Pyrinomonadaceae bacterium]
MKILVIEGIGDITSRAVAFAAQKLKVDIPDLRVIFTDQSKSWTDRHTVRDRKRTIKLIEKWGAEFLDKSKRRHLKKYEALLDAEVEAVLIETPDRTHIKLAQYWLKGNCKWIFIEKPLTTHLALDEALEWVELLELNPKDKARVLVFDHYRGRVHSHFKYAEQMGNLLSIMGRLKSFRFYFLEDHSGTDEEFLNKQKARGRKFKNRNGPIENEGRVDALRYGLILDLMPHVLSVLEYFGDPETIEVLSVRPGIYTGVDFKPGAKAEINSETFAAIEFEFEDNAERPIRGEAYVGKGIFGSESFPEMNGNVKVLEIEGEYGEKLVFDFHYNVISIGNINLYDLERDAYYYLLTDIFFRMNKGTHLGLSVRAAAIILQKLALMKRLINPDELKPYKLGDGEWGLPPMLEDLLANGRNELPLLTP